MKNRSPSVPELSPAQQEVMQIVWEQEEVAASEIRTILAETREVARTTVRTMLERMEAKGWLKHRELGRTYLYSAARPRQATVIQKVLEVVEGACGGSPETLVSALLDSRGLTSGELTRIRSILDEAKASKSIKKRS